MAKVDMAADNSASLTCTGAKSVGSLAKIASSRPPLSVSDSKCLDIAAPLRASRPSWKPKPVDYRKRLIARSGRRVW
jgi:hypothetical protein